MSTLLSLTNAEVVDHLIKLGVAYALALPIGWTQERAERSAGLRTFPLVALASCGLMLIALQMFKGGAEAEARVLEGLITGIGFIGGGAILKNSHAAYGTATAASIWNVGAIGAASAYGLFDIAVILSVVNLATLRLLKPFKQEDAPADDAKSGTR